MLNNIYLSVFLFVGILFVNPVKWGQEVNTDTDWGLHTTNLKTKHGYIKVYFPDDLSSDDTLSGSIIAEPAGKTFTEQEKNSEQLSGYVVESEGNKSDIGQKILKGSIPAAVATTGGVTAVLFKDGKGNTIAKSNLPVSPSPSSEITDFNLHRIGQAYLYR